ncbi:MAG TPA: hypothetical protein VHQ21_02795 [Rhodanobacteraceae bacterium]|jgi:hypothetical protein|nr:hypothetical protein [Rhodanobacteraceae bacterium]
MNPSLSIEQQQWLLIIKARVQAEEIPSDMRASLAAMGLVNETGDISLTDLGAAEAEAIAAANFKFSLMPAT